MPEGDTLARTAATMHRWLAGREITAATTKVEGFPADRLVGRRIEAVDAWGKNLMIRLDDDQVAAHPPADDGVVARLPGGPPVAAARAPGPAHPHLRRPGGGVLQRPGRRAPPAGRHGPPPGARQPRPRRARPAPRPGRGPPPGPGRSRPTAPSASCCSTSGSWPASATSGAARRSSSRATTRGRPVSAVTDEQLDALVSTAGRLMRASVESRTGVPDAAVGLPPGGPAVPPLPHAGEVPAPGRAGPHRLLVPHLPARTPHRSWRPRES